MFRRQSPRLSQQLRRPISQFLRDPTENYTHEQNLDYCKTEGIDMASSLSSEFLHLQSALFRYRVVRLADEMKYAAKHPMSSFPKASTFFLHLLLLPLVFWVAMCVGRFSWVPLPSPDSEAAALAEEEAEDNKKSDSEETKDAEKK